jgi:tetratricopeptide (TPR) repeat protein
VNLGAVYYQKKDYASAVPPLRRALELNPSLPGAHGMLGTALLGLGYARDAVPHLEKGELEDLLGVALLESGRAREAVDKLEAALVKRPDDPDLLYYLSAAHGQLTKQIFEKLRDTHPDSPRTHQMLGDAYGASGSRDKAEKEYRAALAGRADLRGVHYALGELALQSGDYERAEAEFRAETEISPGNAAAAFKRGVSLGNLGRTPDAIAELRRADGLQPAMPETQLELGKLLNSSGDAAAAERLLRKVLEAEQGTALAESAHFQLSQVYRKLGRPADADRELKAFQALRARQK